MAKVFCHHVRIEGFGIKRKAVGFGIECLPFRTVDTKEEKGVIVEISGTEKTGNFCPRCFRQYK